MGRRFGQLAGLVAFALVLGRLGRLLQTGPGTPQWHLILLASAFLGGIVWWLIRQVVGSTALALTLFSLGGLVLFLRISVPDTLLAGVLPSAETPAALASTLEQAIAQIRHGIPPILPSEGVIAVLAILMWVVGALYTWGYLSGPAIAMVLPSIVLYLQFAIFDRASAGLGWMMASGLMLALALTTLALERKQDVGRARDDEGRPKPARSMAAAVVMAGLIGVVAVVTANSATGVVSEYGNVPWRSGGGDYGLGGGSFALDRFVSMQQDLINRADIPVFRVTYTDQAPDVSQVYWTLEALDEFDGNKWGRSDSEARPFESGRGLGPASNAYQGTATEWTHRIYSTGLAGLIAPRGGVPIDIQPVDEDGGIDPREFWYLQDSALYLPTELRPEDVYQVTAQYPRRNQDLGALATAENGELSPMFAAAAEAGAFNHVASSPPNESAAVPDDLDAYTELPNVIPRGVRNVAQSITTDATTDFERAWMLQHWFRDSGRFTYSVDVTTGQSTLDIDRWLNDPSSLNYRTGYCEQFALSMAVLGREMGIPSRVVLGFTPGTKAVDSNGTAYVEVLDTNAHAWVEMWMDGFGWVHFDPTPRGDTQPTSLTLGFTPSDFTPERPPLELQTPAPAGQNGFFEPLAEGATSTQPGPRWWLIALVTLVPLISLIPLSKRIRRRRRLKAVRQGDVTAAWDELVDRLTDLGQPVPSSKTPVEFARETNTALVPIAVSYSSTIYGGREDQGQESHLYGVEGWVGDQFDGVDRFKAAVNPASLLKRD